MSASSKKFTWKSKIAAVALGLVAALLLAEAMVRLLDLPPRPLIPAPIPNYQLSDNPILRFEFRPNHITGNEAYDIAHVNFETNAEGMRDRTYPIQKPDGTYRIICLGDSTTVGLGVKNLDDIYPKVLERLLNEHARRFATFEVLSFGVTGYHTYQEVELLRAKGLKYKPDFVIVLFCYNDFQLDQDGNIYITLLHKNPTFLQNPQYGFYRAMMKHSRLALVVDARLRANLRGPDAIDEHHRWYRDEVLGGRSPFAAGLERLDALRREHGFGVLVAILPMLRSPFDKYREDDQAIHDRVRREAAAYPGIEVIDLKDYFAAVDNYAPNFAVEGIHMNEHGMKTTAVIFYELLRSRCAILTDAPPLPK